LEFQARAIRQKQEIKRIKIGKEEVKLPQFADDTILYLRYPKNSTKKLFEIINSFSKVAGHKINIEKSVAFLYTNNEQTERNQRNNLICNSLKTIKYLGINLKKETKDLLMKEERNQRRHQKMERPSMFVGW
jgi:hypothetical protein